MLELRRKKGGSQYKMRRNRGIKKIVIFVLLSVLAFGNTIPYHWIKVGGNWYYLNSSGAMVTGSQTIDGKVYNFASSGEWI